MLRVNSRNLEIITFILQSRIKDLKGKGLCLFLWCGTSDFTESFVALFKTLGSWMSNKSRYYYVMKTVNLLKSET